MNTFKKNKIDYSFKTSFFLIQKFIALKNSLYWKII